MPGKFMLHGGKFLLSPSGKFAVHPDCCCPPRGGMVLLWNTDNEHLGIVAEVQDLYEAMGLTVHYAYDYTGEITDYGLILWLEAVEDPSWWSVIAAGAWRGRLHMTSNHGTWTPDSIAYINSKTGLTGITINEDTHDIGCNQLGTSETHDLTDGQDNIYYAATASVSGGTTLSKTVTTDDPWIAANQVGRIDFVISGDADHVRLTDCENHVTLNTPFIQNLWTVKV